MSERRRYERAVLGSLLLGHGDPSQIERNLFDPGIRRDVFDQIRTATSPAEIACIAVNDPPPNYREGNLPTFWRTELADCMIEACVPQNIPAMIRALERLRRRSELTSLARGLLASLEQGDDDATLRNTSARIDALVRTGPRREIPHFRDGLPELFSVTTRRSVPLGIDALSRLRIVPGNLCVVAARPGQGKTAMLGTIALACITSGRPTLFLSLEMPALQIRQRLIAGHARIPLDRVEAPEDPALIAPANELAGLPIWVVDEDVNRLSLEQMGGVIRDFSQQNPEGVVLLDYLQLVSTSARYERRYELIGHACRELKYLARACSVPVIAAAQLSRAAEDRQRPQLSDLRESGEIEQVADQVLLIHRHEEEGPKMRVAKYRQGPTWSLDVRFTGEFCLFEDRDAFV